MYVLNSSRGIIKRLASPCCQDACESSCCFSSAMLKKFLTRVSSQPKSAKAGSCSSWSTFRHDFFLDKLSQAVALLCNSTRMKINENKNWFKK